VLRVDVHGNSISSTNARAMTPAKDQANEK
jgi:hypothetical protein